MEYKDTLPLLVQEGKELILNIEALKSLLLNDKVKNLPVCVISIAGAFRMGKSFLLNLILRYFMKKGWETHDGQWLMGDDEDNLKVGIKWSGGAKGHNQGIMAWGGTITVDKKDGSKVAIILLDTQGNWDNKETKTKSARVFALSSLCSSLQIFNLFRQIQSNDLEYLQAFVELSKGPISNQNSNADGNSENTKAFFQDLLFVVRDWVHWDYSHGSSGGQKYLENLQSEIKIFDSKKESMINYLQKTFTKIGCYLMPTPGEKVQYNRPDDKPLYASDLGNSFSLYIRKLMEEYLNPEKLTNKTIELSGETTCEGLYEFIVGCAENILSGEGPILMLDMQAIAEINNTRCRDKKLAWYKETIENKLQNTILWNDYDNLLKQTKQATRRQLLQEIDYGNSNPQNTADDLLDQLFNKADLISMRVMQNKRHTILHQEIEKWLTSSILLLKGRYFAKESDLKKFYLDTLQILSINLDGRDSDFIEHKLDSSKTRFCQCYEDKKKWIRNKKILRTPEKWLDRVDELPRTEQVFKDGEKSDKYTTAGKTPRCLSKSVNILIKKHCTLSKADLNKIEDILRLNSDVDLVEFCDCKIGNDYFTPVESRKNTEKCKISKLIISFTDHFKDFSRFFYSTFGGCEIKSLCLVYANLDDQEVENLHGFLLLNQVKGIECLDISYNNKISPCGFEQIGNMIAEQGIKTLRAIDCDLEKMKLAKLFEGLKNVNLRELNVSYNDNLTENGFEMLAKLVASKGIEILKLRGCQLTEKNIQVFYNKLKETDKKVLVKLNELDVSYNPEMTPAGCVILGLIIKKFGITTLNLAGCGISKKHLTSLMSITDIRLHAINLRENSYSGDIMVEIAKIVSKFKIQELDISDCMFSVRELKNFRTNLNRTKLQKLHLGDKGCELGMEYIQEVCKLLQTVNEMVYLWFHGLDDSCRRLLNEESEKLSVSIQLCDKPETILE